MATQKFSPLQVSYAKSWSGLTQDNHLYSIFQNDVQKVMDTMVQVFDYMGLRGIQTLLGKYPTKVLPHDGEYSWSLKGDDRRAIAIVGYTAPDQSYPGLGYAQFELELAERFFQRTDYLIFDDREYGVRIVDDGRSNGTNWIYTVEHMRPDENFYIPTGLLTAGRRVSKEYSITTNVMTDEFGGTQFSSQFEMRNHFSTMSKEYLVPGNMHDRPLLISMTTPGGETVNTWTRWQEAVADFQWIREKNNQLFYGKSNKRNDGTFVNRASNGFVIKQSAGLRDQISPSYKFYYTKLSLDYLMEVALSLSINILPQDRREFLIMTGERGMIAFHKLIEDKVAMFQPLDSKRVFGSGQNLGFGGQYRSFLGPQGVKWNIMHMPEYDDPIDNRLEDPDGGFTENYRMTIMNIGTTGGNPNIQRVVPQGRVDLKGYTVGLTSPYGPNTGGMMSAPIDGYGVYYASTEAVMLSNPLSACELLKNVSAQY